MANFLALSLAFLLTVAASSIFRKALIKPARTLKVIEYEIGTATYVEVGISTPGDFKAFMVEFDK